MKKSIFNIALVAVFATLSFTACTVTNGGKSNLSSVQEREITAGVVQREIKKGMSGAEVAEALGSPNIVTKDANDNETWVYDKIATEASYNESNSGLFLILYGQSNHTANASVTQKTLTVVIKFNPQSKVDSFTYHQSKF